MVQIGTARVPLPIPVGLPLAGYAGRTGTATGIHDELYVRALVALDGEAALCVLLVELLCVDASFVAEVRQKIAARTLLPPEAIMIAATHTHAGPAGIARFSLDDASELYLGTINAALRSQVQAALVEAATQAIGCVTEARLAIGTAHVEDVARNRMRPDGPYDPDLPFVLALDAEDHVIGAIFSFATHSTVLGSDNLAYSGDLMGAICRRLEAHWGSRSVALGLAGAAGDISTRFTRRAATLEELDRLAGRAADSILEAGLAPIAAGPLTAARRVIPLGLVSPEDPEMLRTRLAEAQGRLASLEGATAAERRLIQVEIDGLQIALEGGRHRPAGVEAEVQVLRLGDVLLAGFPGEMFVAFGLETRRTLAGYHVLIAGYANDYLGYVPTPETRGGYEATMAMLASDSGPRLVEAICRLAGSEVQRVDPQQWHDEDEWYSMLSTHDWC